MKGRLVSRMSTLGAVLLLLALVAATATTTVAVTNRAWQPVPRPDSLVRIAVIGDSYSAGSGNDVVWPALIAAGAPLSVSVVAVRDASYAGGAGRSGRFASQVDKALASKPSMIVVFGGLGDAGQPREQIIQSAVDLYAELIRRAPTSELVVLGPIWHTKPVPGVFTTLDAALERAAWITHATYISLIHKDWLTTDGAMQGDDAPTDKGQLILARQLNSILLEQIREPRRTVLP